MTKRLLVDNDANTDNGFDICFRQLSPICLLCISQKPMFQCTICIFVFRRDDLLLHLQSSAFDLIPYTPQRF